MRSIALLLTTTALLFSSAACAENDWLVISGAAYHFDRRDELRGDNPGAGWERPSQQWPLSWMAGYYLNSYDRDTFYAGARWEPLRWEHVKLGVFVGAASGYDTPIVALPMASVEYGRVGINFVAAPTIGSYTGYVGAQLKFRFN